MQAGVGKVDLSFHASCAAYLKVRGPLDNDLQKRGLADPWITDNQKSRATALTHDREDVLKLIKL